MPDPDHPDTRGAAPAPGTLTRDLLAAAKAAGAEAADAMAVAGTSLSIDVCQGALERAERAERTDIGLRVLIGRRQVVVSASDVSARTVEELAERAVAMARAAPEDPYAGLACPDILAREWDLAALELNDAAPEPAPAALQDTARATEAAALRVPGVSQVQSASAGHARTQVHIAASNGFSGGYTRTESALSCTAIAGEGAEMERDHDGDSRIFAADLRAPEEIGRRAGARAVARLGARRPPAGAWPVVYDERVAASLIGHLLSAMNGAAVARGASWLLGREGAQVLPVALSLAEDPLRPRGPASRPFDAEGLPTRRRDLVAHGTLNGWLLDLASARKLGRAPTGHARRSPGGMPAPASSNVMLTEGARDRAGLLAEMGTGLLVTSLIGATINPTTGDYSRGAAGFWVEGGEIAYPVNECTIAGHLPAMLRSLVPANDARPHLARAVPSLLVEGLTLAGA